MKHLDGDTVALAALGEDVGDAARAHLDGCAHCRAEVVDLAALADAARTSGPELEPPSDAVWSGIRSRIDARTDTETGAASAPAGASGGGAAGGVPGAVQDGASPAPERDSAASGPGARPGASNRPAGRPGGRAGRRAGRDEAARSGAGSAPRRRRRPGARTWSFVAGAVVAALVVLGVAWGISARSGGQVLATANLAPVAASGGTGSGSAELERTANGIEELRLQVGGDRVRGYPEVWLIAKDGRRMVSLGTLHDGSAVLPVPAGLDVHDYATVDVSDEPFDGNPAHSGDSVLRGSLTF
ncbi:anti-sigma factor [Tersicoccus sp. MR15.9]|uniref:anti-sigma factor n=1 Tax=Tersicoccus mangrovi TaxID=3121635 RepID=UPI002FE527C9